MYKKLRLFLVSYLVAGCFDVVAIPAVRTHIILRLPLLASYSLFDMHSCVQRINTQDKLGLSKEQIANYAYAALLVNHTSVALGRSFDSSEAQGLIDQGLLEGELRDEVNPQVLSCIYNQAMKDPKFFDDTSQHSLALFFLLWKCLTAAEKAGLQDVADYDVADYIEFKIIGDQNDKAHDMAVLLEEEGILGKIPVAHLDTQCELITKDIIECAQFDDRRDVELFMYEYMYKNLQKK